MGFWVLLVVSLVQGIINNNYCDPQWSNQHATNITEPIEIYGLGFNPIGQPGRYFGFSRFFRNVGMASANSGAEFCSTTVTTAATAIPIYFNMRIFFDFEITLCLQSSSNALPNSLVYGPLRCIENNKGKACEKLTFRPLLTNFDATLSSFCNPAGGHVAGRPDINPPFTLASTRSLTFSLENPAPFGDYLLSINMQGYSSFNWEQLTWMRIARRVPSTLMTSWTAVTTFWQTATNGNLNALSTAPICLPPTPTPLPTPGVFSASIPFDYREGSFQDGNLEEVNALWISSGRNRLYIGDKKSRGIRAIDLIQKNSTFFSLALTGEQPWGLTADEARNRIYISTSAGRIQVRELDTFNWIPQFNNGLLRYYTVANRRELNLTESKFLAGVGWPNKMDCDLATGDLFTSDHEFVVIYDANGNFKETMQTDNLIYGLAWDPLRKILCILHRYDLQCQQRGVLDRLWTPVWEITSGWGSVNLQDVIKEFHDVRFDKVTGDLFILVSYPVVNVGGMTNSIGKQLLLIFDARFRYVSSTDIYYASSIAVSHTGDHLLGSTTCPSAGKLYVATGGGGASFDLAPAIGTTLLFACNSPYGTLNRQIYNLEGSLDSWHCLSSSHPLMTNRKLCWQNLCTGPVCVDSTKDYIGSPVIANQYFFRPDDTDIHNVTTVSGFYVDNTTGTIVGEVSGEYHDAEPPHFFFRLNVAMIPPYVGQLSIGVHYNQKKERYFRPVIAANFEGKFIGAPEQTKFTAESCTYSRTPMLWAPCTTSSITAASYCGRFGHTVSTYIANFVSNRGPSNLLVCPGASRCMGVLERATTIATPTFFTFGPGLIPKINPREVIAATINLQALLHSDDSYSAGLQLDSSLFRVVIVLNTIEIETLYNNIPFSKQREGFSLTLNTCSGTTTCSNWNRRDRWSFTIPGHVLSRLILDDGSIRLSMTLYPSSTVIGRSDYAATRVVINNATITVVQRVQQTLTTVRL